MRKADPLIPMLQSASLHALLMIAAKALTRAGFGDVQILDRRQPQEKSRHGGHELLAETAIGFVPVRVVVKVVRDDARQRMADELAGVVLRRQADIGLLLTPYHISPQLMKNQESVRPVRVLFVDGELLAKLMRKHRIGVRAEGGVDFAFFTELELVSDRLLTFIKEAA